MLAVGGKMVSIKTVKDHQSKLAALDRRNASKPHLSGRIPSKQDPYLISAHSPRLGTSSLRAARTTVDPPAGLHRGETGCLSRTGCVSDVRPGVAVSAVASDGVRGVTRQTPIKLNHVWRCGPLQPSPTPISTLQWGSVLPLCRTDNTCTPNDEMES